MQFTGKQKLSLAALVGYGLSIIVDPFTTVIRLNVETWATKNGYDKLYESTFASGWGDWIVTLWEAFTGSFGLGLVIGLAIFAFWDLIPKAAKKLKSPGDQKVAAITEAKSGIIWHRTVDGEPVNFLGMTKRGSEPIRVTSFQIEGENRTGKSIDKIDGFVRSNITNRQFPIFMNVDGNLYPPEQTYGIPDGAKFGVNAPFFDPSPSREGFLADDFLAEFGDFSFVMNFDGERYEERFSTEQSEATLLWFQRETRPQVPTGVRVRTNPDG